MKSFLVAGALAFVAIPFASLPSQADALVITTDHNHDHDADRHDHDTDLHTGAIVVHKDEPSFRTDDNCKTKTVQKSTDDGTVTKTKQICH